MNYFLYILLGLVPSIIWLLFYLRKDVHPEPNRMVIKIFLWGIMIGFVAILVELGFAWISTQIPIKVISGIFSIFIGVALVEEFFKYLVVRVNVLSNPEFDEPIDAMIYMIIAGLGFAALENILVIFPIPQLSTPPSSSLFLMEGVIALTFLRFISATFLHALCGGLLGYFIALSLYNIQSRKKIIALGLASVTLLHGFYNWSIINLEEGLNIIGAILILGFLAILTTILFKKVKKLSATCKVKIK